METGDSEEREIDGQLIEVMKGIVQKNGVVTFAAAVHQVLIMLTPGPKVTAHEKHYKERLELCLKRYFEDIGVTVNTEIRVRGKEKEDVA